MVLMPHLKDEIISFTQLGVHLGFDYAVIKHCSDDEQHTLGIDYSQYANLHGLLSKAESMSNEQTKSLLSGTRFVMGIYIYLNAFIDRSSCYRFLVVVFWHLQACFLMFVTRNSILVTIPRSASSTSGDLNATGGP